MERRSVTTVYADMCADLFHFGHVRFLRLARGIGDRLIVGVHSDTDIVGYKRVPIMTMAERVEVVEACRYVDSVLTDAPLQPTVEYLVALGVDVVCHGDDLSQEKIEFLYGRLTNYIPVRLVPYTSGISTSDIIMRIRQSLIG
jgi:glycerol-3-phosphate cytidylyltransferase